jgi:monoamine oxidase
LPKISEQISKISRRQFLRNSAVIAAGISFGACRDNTSSPVEVISPSDRIIIVGAGMAGLVAAYELSKTGYDVLVLEANNRIGGRVFTIRDPFSNEQFAEAGAARIPPSHNHTLHYAQEFGLQLDNFYPRSGNYFEYRGRNRRIINNLSYLASSPWPGSVPHSQYVKIRGGMDNLAKEFANRLQGKIIFGSPVKIIDQSNAVIKVKVEDGSEYSAEKVIVTVPLTVLNKIGFNPQLSAEKIEAANGNYNYASSTRVYLQTGSRFWESDNLNGWGRSDWPEEIWQPTFDQPGTGGILMTYLSNRRADELDALPDNERVISLINRWQDIFPAIDENVESGTSHSWVEQEWSNGAYASPSSSQSRQYDSIIALPEGRIHFAGEHISNYHGWIQGALASGLRVVDEIIKTDVYA